MNRMTKQEAIRRIKDHMDIHHMYEPEGTKISEALEMAIKSLEQSRLFVYKKPGVMVGHNYTDDVAITYATSMADAYRKFSKAYDLSISDISEVWFNSDGVAILTDY